MPEDPHAAMADLEQQAREAWSKAANMKIWPKGEAPPADVTGAEREAAQAAIAAIVTKMRALSKATGVPMPPGF